MKEKLHSLIENDDDKLVKMLYAVAKEYIDEDDYVFTEEDITEFETTSMNITKGTSKAYSWDEAKKIITSK